MDRRARGPSVPPAERVRSRFAERVGAEIARELPSGYQRMGRVLLLRLPPALRPHFGTIGEIWREELGVATVLVRTGPIEGELRAPHVERVAGDPTETEVVEHGVRWQFDAARVMFAAGNRTERLRARRIVRPGESVVDLFAGIGYFAIPAALSGPATRVRAVEKNPVAYDYLVRNIERNGVTDRVTPILGDNRDVALEPGSADRVFLGYLPSAIPWVGRAAELLRPTGGTLHVHTVADAREARSTAEAEVRSAVTEAGGRCASLVAREVKPYGPGRTHVVVDAVVGPPRA